MNIKIEPEDKSLSQYVWLQSNRDDDLQNDIPNEGLSTGCVDHAKVKQEVLFDDDANREAKEIAFPANLRNIKKEEVEIEFQKCDVEECDPLTKCQTIETKFDVSKELPPCEVSSQKKSPISCIDVDEFNIKREIISHQPVVVVIKLERTAFYDSNFVCSVCFDIFSSLRSLITHSNIEMQSGQYSCVQKIDLTKRQFIHPDETPYKCNHCQYSCTFKSSFKRHQLIHSGEKPFKCDHCQFASSQISHLKRHQSIHSGAKPFKCDDCQYSCAEKSSLKRHQFLHSGEKPFKCDQCQLTFTRISYLKRHQSIHSDERPFKCDQCQYSCSQMSNLKTHKMRHSGEKPFKCDECQYSSVHSSNLKIHQLKHSGNKPFKCDQ